MAQRLFAGTGLRLVVGRSMCGSCSLQNAWDCSGVGSNSPARSRIASAEEGRRAPVDRARLLRLTAAARGGVEVPRNHSGNRAPHSPRRAPAPRALLALTFERVWLDEQRVVAVQPKPSFAPYFQTPALQTAGGAVCK